MQEAFEKLRGVDIFSLKSYMEPTSFGSFNGAWVLINELFVNFFFFILNAVVGFFSLLIRVLESVDLYSAYNLEWFHWLFPWRSHKWFLNFYFVIRTCLLSFLPVFLLKRKFHKNYDSCLYGDTSWL